MSAPSANNVGGPGRVTCETSKKQQVAVDLEDLLCSHTFKEMYDKLGLEEHDEFPGVFPARGISSHVFKKVMAWCREHKGLPEPAIEKYPFTQEVKWLNLTPFEQRFLDIPVPALFELITAASFLDIPSLRHSACQAIAALIKGKRPAEVRLILRQQCDLTEEDFQEIFDGSPWLKQRHEQEVDIQEPIQSPAEVLVTIFEKLPRADIERFQLISSSLRDVILDNQKPFRPLSEERGPLSPVDVVLDVTLHGCHRVASLDGPSRKCWGVDGLAKHLKFCRVRKLEITLYGEISDKLLDALVPLKRTWKDATFDAALRNFSSDEQFRFAFSEVFMCTEIQLGRYGEGTFARQPFLRLPAMSQCSVLEIGSAAGVLEASEILEWLEGGAPKELAISRHAITGGFRALVDALKTAFLDAERPLEYIVSIYHIRPRQASQQLSNDKTKEQLVIHTDGDGDLVVERKLTLSKQVA